MSEQLSLFGIDASPTPPTFRGGELFLAIFPDESAVAQIAKLTQEQCVEHRLTGRPRPNTHLHISLFNLSGVLHAPDAIARVSAAAATIVQPPFEVTFDRVMSFGTQHASKRSTTPFVLCGVRDIVPIDKLQRTMAAVMKSIAFRSGPRLRNPHVTLLYDKYIVPERRIDPIAWVVREFVLVHSASGLTTYTLLGRWPLRV